MSSRFFYTIFLIGAVLSTAAALAGMNINAGGEAFLAAFKNCDEYSSTDTIEVDGIASKVSKKILGWDGYTCKYREIIEINDIGYSSTVNCAFSAQQLQEIYSVMLQENENYKKNPAKYQNMTIEAAQNSPVLKVWNKYLGDSAVCKIKM